MSSKSFVISYAGQHESALKSCGEPCREHEYATPADAKYAFACVWPAETDATLASMVEVRTDDGIYIYLDQDDADNDPDGSQAVACIERVDRYQARTT
jgi:hypothetical protein